MALLAATIMRFQRTPPCRVLFTTHFLEVKNKRTPALHHQIIVCWVEFKQLIP